MSRIGNKPIIIEEGVTISIDGGLVLVKGTKGDLSVELPRNIKAHIEENKIHVKTVRGKDSKQGLFRSLLQNAVTGVSRGWTKELELIGVGFRAQTSGKELTLNLGFSHPVVITADQKVSFQVKNNLITVLGIDKYSVGETAASIRRVKPPEPYKGKGIRYKGEVVRKKAGKSAKAVGGSQGK